MCTTLRTRFDWVDGLAGLMLQPAMSRELTSPFMALSSAGLDE
jgi:hypothetical protein